VSSIIFILLTRYNERVMLPEFGSPIIDALFDPNDDEAVARIRDGVEKAIATWDDRIQVVNVDVSRDEHLLDIQIVFRNRKDPIDREEHIAGIQIPITVLGGQL
jgi:phage baseplate assembly protein W